MNLTKPILGYFTNLATFIFGIAISGLLLLDNPNKGIGIIYFLINILVGSVVWHFINKMSFKLSFVCTGTFYASLGICGFLALTLADNLLYFFRSIEFLGLEISAIAFYAFLSLIISTGIFLPTSIWLYIKIKHWIPTMSDDILRKYR